MLSPVRRKSGGPPVAFIRSRGILAAFVRRLEITGSADLAIAFSPVFFPQPPVERFAVPL